MGIIGGIKGVMDRKGRMEAQWPPEESLERLKYYRDGASLYNGDQADALNRLAGTGNYKPPKYRLYVVQNVLSTITDLLVERAFGEGLSVRAPTELVGTQAFIDDVFKRSKCKDLFVMEAAGASYRGDSVYKAYFDARRRHVRITSVHPSVFFPEFDPLDETEMVAADIGQVITTYLPGETAPRPFLWIERHELRDGTGWVTNRLWKLTKNEVTKAYAYDPIKDEVPLDAIKETAPLVGFEEYPTGIDDMLIVHATNKRTSEGQPWGRAWGISDYGNLIDLQAALNDNRSGFRDVLRKMVKPIVAGPDLRDENGNVNIEDFDYYSSNYVGEGADPFKIFTWDVNTSGVEAELDQLLDAVAMVAKVDSSAMKTPETGGPISAKGIRASQLLTQGSARRKQAAHGDPIMRIVSIATKLAAVKLASGELDWEPPQRETNTTAGGQTTEAIVAPDEPGKVYDLVPVEWEDLTCEWRDGLPDDRMDLIQEQAEMIAAGVQSAIRAAMELHDMDRDEAQELMDEIAAEQPAQPQQASPFDFAFGQDEGMAGAEEGQQ